MKAMQFYHQLEASFSCSGRVNISSKEKCKPYLKKNGEDYVVIGDVENPDPSTILNFEDLFLVSQNIKLLENDPFREDLKLPFQFVRKMGILNELSSVTEKGTDWLHGIISLQRFSMRSLEKLLNTFINCGVLKESARKEFYTFYVKNKVYLYDQVFESKGDFDVELDYKRRLNLNANRNTIKMKKYTTIFNQDVIKKLFGILIKDHIIPMKENDDLLQETLQVLIPFLSAGKEFCDCLKFQELMSIEKVRNCAFQFDFIYVFTAHIIQVSQFHSNYTLDFINTLPFDLFF